jgi:hypothetical protein
VGTPHLRRVAAFLKEEDKAAILRHQGLFDYEQNLPEDTGEPQVLKQIASRSRSSILYSAFGIIFTLQNPVLA